MYERVLIYPDRIFKWSDFLQAFANPGDAELLHGHG